MPTPHVYRRRGERHVCYGRSQRDAVIIAAAANVMPEALQARAT